MFLLPNKRQRRVYVEMAPRTGANTWGAWQDLTPWFIEQETDLNIDIDDSTFEGKIEQNNVILKFNNLTGVFNEEGTTTGSLWDSATKYIYHSRIRYYDWVPDQDATLSGNKPTVNPTIDGLITGEINYDTDQTCEILIASKLDILKEEYILENYYGRSRTVTSQIILNRVVDLFNTKYSALGVNTNFGVVRENILYDNVAPYSKNLLKMLYEVLDQGGGFGGLTTDNELFFSYFDFDTIVGSETITKSNFTSDVNSLLIYHFDDTDYSSGTGTTLYDKSGNGYDAAVDLTEVSNVWRSTGHFDNSCRNFHYLNDNGVGGLNFTLNSFSVEMVLTMDSYLIEWISTSGDYQNASTPVIAFTEDTSNGVICFSEAATNKKSCGLIIDHKGTLFWASHDTGGTSPRRSFEPKSFIELDQLPIEGSTFYIALTYDHTTGIYKYYLDGSLRKTFSEEGYAVDDITVNKIVVRGYSTSYNTPATYQSESVEQYCSGFKLSSVALAESDIFSSALKVFGQEFNIYDNIQTLDNYSNNKVKRITSIADGKDHIKNTILIKENTGEKGIVQFSYDDSQPATFGIYDPNTGWYTVGEHQDIVRAINWTDKSNQSLKDNATYLREELGLSAEMGGPLGAYSTSIILRSNGKVDYRRLQFFVHDVEYDRSIGFVTNTEKYFGFVYAVGGGDKAEFFMSSQEAASSVLASDDTSILKHGRRIMELPNYQMVSATLDKETMGRNVLAKRKNRKSRLTLLTTYDTSLVIGKKLKISVVKENTAQKPHHFEEAGMFKPWTENGSYRERFFFIVGIRHNKDGKYTQLRLREV